MVKPVQIGDLVTRTGSFASPGVVVQKNDDGSIVVDTEPLTVSEFHRYTNTSGLSEDEKDEFNNILDQIYARPNEAERVQGIEEEINRLRDQQANQNIVRYLRNQQAYLMRNSRG
jgi:hypothetical protein